MLQSLHSTVWNINRCQTTLKQYPNTHVESKHHVNSKVDKASATVTYRLNLANVFIQGTRKDIHRCHTEVSLQTDK